MMRRIIYMYIYEHALEYGYYYYKEAYHNCIYGNLEFSTLVAKQILCVCSLYASTMEFMATAELLGIRPIFGYLSATNMLTRTQIPEFHFSSPQHRNVCNLPLDEMDRIYLQKHSDYYFTFVREKNVSEENLYMKTFILSTPNIAQMISIINEGTYPVNEQSRSEFLSTLSDLKSLFSMRALRRKLMVPIFIQSNCDSNMASIVTSADANVDDMEMVVCDHDAHVDGDCNGNEPDYNHCNETTNTYYENIYAFFERNKFEDLEHYSECELRLIDSHIPKKWKGQKYAKRFTLEEFDLTEADRLFQNHIDALRKSKDARVKKRRIGKLVAAIKSYGCVIGNQAAMNDGTKVNS